MNVSRSMNASMHEGATDGKYKKIVQDRDGVVHPETYADRRQLDDLWYGIHEAATKVLPDGTVTTTPNYVVSPTAKLI